MKNTWIKTLAGISAAGVMTISQTASADYGKLLETLRDNGTITAEQAEGLKAQRVRPANSFVRDLQIRGRVQTQFGYTTTDNDEGSSDYSTFEVRRARIGLRGTFPNDLRAQLEANLVPGSSLSMRSAFLQWRKHKPAYIKVGFDKPHSSLEENTSSAEIITVERTLISNTVAAPGPMTGFAVDGDLGTIYYGAGVYTDQDNSNAANASSDYLVNLHLGVKLDGLVGEGSKLRIQGSYLTSDDESGSLAYEDVYTLALHFAQGAFDLRTEYILGDNDGEETSGFYIMPSLMLSNKLQGVVRYEYAESDKATGLRAASRYARRSEDLAVRDATETSPKFDPQRGDEYQAVYLGLNYYIQGDGNKVMLGIEFSELDNTYAGTLEATTLYAAWRALF
ncbi:MAG: hypothetical protein JJU29_03825 [Verrucomicrobia bacterium]|nr:hypothetical protein [Verrucomicrobiota bacterium]MCH8510902.1 OprO/OprP family phosphate-selective porin [Kiritimatiellia bacterium]